jgi:hypothetical protein
MPHPSDKTLTELETELTRAINSGGILRVFPEDAGRFLRAVRSLRTSWESAQAAEEDEAATTPLEDFERAYARLMNVLGPIR